MTEGLSGAASESCISSIGKYIGFACITISCGSMTLIISIFKNISTVWTAAWSIGLAHLMATAISVKEVVPDIGGSRLTVDKAIIEGLKILLRETIIN
jgi:hypothetical protein